MRTNTIRLSRRSALLFTMLGIISATVTLRNVAVSQQPPGANVWSDFEGPFNGESSPPDEPLSLWYRRPARLWVEALAIGNGRLGAMVYGGVERERIQLNEDTLWAGGPYDPNNPEALAALPEAR